MINNPPLPSDSQFASEKIKIWQCILTEAKKEAKSEPLLADFLDEAILNHDDFATALSFHLPNLLCNLTASAQSLQEIFSEAYKKDSAIVDAAFSDILAIRNRDSACNECGTPFLYYKGFHALQAFRVAHWLWHQQRREFALFLQSRISTCFSVDIHPAAKVGYGLMLDHATGIVIGETSVIGDNVSIMQSVTLGGTGKETKDRHPKIGAGVLIGAGSKILGNIHIGEGAKVGAGSVVLNDVPAHSMVTGVPAVVIGTPDEAMPSLSMNQNLS